MLARKTTAPRSPHCRTCGKPMKGHKKDLCQLGQSTLGSIFEDTATPASLPSTPPLTPTPSRPQLSGVSIYSNKPISLEPSWEAPPDGTFYHRRNPYLVGPLSVSKVARETPLRRTESWISTEKAESEFGDQDHDDDDNDIDDDCFSSTLKSVTSANAAARYSHFPPSRLSTLPLTPPITPPNSQNTVNRNAHHHTQRQIDAIDAAGNKVVGLDISTLNENIKTIIHQADLAGYYATIVRPRIGYNRGSVDIRTNEDADKHTTVFVSTGPDTMSINLVCSEAFRKAKLLSEGSGPFLNSTKTWCSVFFAMFFASLIAFWASLVAIRTLW